MAKTETVHTRVTQDIKQKADSIFEKLGLTTSQAIMLFLTATVNHNGLPFEMTIPEEDIENYAFVKSIVTTDGVEPTPEARKIISLLSRGDIDYETAKFAIGRIHRKKR